ncbi:hypothetical protein BG005_001433 [Podila minutissima]|nr:hypothetical protein BG005_001433 [Podila minutissima]
MDTATLLAVSTNEPTICYLNNCQWRLRNNQQFRPGRMWGIHPLHAAQVLGATDSRHAVHLRSHLFAICNIFIWAVLHAII